MTPEEAAARQARYAAHRAEMAAAHQVEARFATIAFRVTRPGHAPFVESAANLPAIAAHYPDAIKVEVVSATPGPLMMGECW